MVHSQRLCACWRDADLCSQASQETVAVWLSLPESRAGVWEADQGAVASCLPAPWFVPSDVMREVARGFAYTADSGHLGAPLVLGMAVGPEDPRHTHETHVSLSHTNEDSSAPPLLVCLLLQWTEERTQKGDQERACTSGSSGPSRSGRRMLHRLPLAGRLSRASCDGIWDACPGQPRTQTQTGCSWRRSRQMLNDNQLSLAPPTKRRGSVP